MGFGGLRSGMQAGLSLYLPRSSFSGPSLVRTAQHMCSEDRSSHRAAEATPPRPALGPGAGRGRGMWRHWGWLTPALLHLMSDLERQRTRCSSVLRSPHLSSGERTCPQPAWLGRWALVRESPALAACHCLGGGFEKELLSFSAALDWLGRRQPMREAERTARGPLLL